MSRIDLIQLRRGTAAQWTSVNPVLAEGEMGLETDTRKTKFGDGATAWNSLSYASASAALAEDTAYDATAWNSVTAPPTKNAVRDKLVLMDAAVAAETAARIAADAELMPAPLVLDAEPVAAFTGATVSGALPAEVNGDYDFTDWDGSSTISVSNGSGGSMAYSSYSGIWEILKGGTNQGMSSDFDDTFTTTPGAVVWRQADGGGTVGTVVDSFGETVPTAARIGQFAQLPGTPDRWWIAETLTEWREVFVGGTGSGGEIIGNIDGGTPSGSVDDSPIDGGTPSGSGTGTGSQTFSGQVELTAQTAASPDSAMTRDLSDQRSGRSVFDIVAGDYMICDRVDHHGSLQGACFNWVDTFSGTGSGTAISSNNARRVGVGKMLAAGAVAGSLAQMRSDVVILHNWSNTLLYTVGDVDTTFPVTRCEWGVGLGSNNFTDRKSGTFIGVINNTDIAPVNFQWISYSDTGVPTVTNTGIPYQNVTGTNTSIAIQLRVSTDGPNTVNNPRITATIWLMSQNGFATLIGSASIAHPRPNAHNTRLFAFVSSTNAVMKRLHFRVTALRAPIF